MNNLSIHPRHWPDTGNGKKLNTSKPAKPPCKKLDRKLSRLTARRLDREATLKSNPKNVLAYKVPGSMK